MIFVMSRDLARELTFVTFVLWLTFDLEDSRFGVWGPRRLLHGFQFHPPSRKTAAWTVAVGPFSQTRGLSDLSPALRDSYSPFDFDFILLKSST